MQTLHTTSSRCILYTLCQRWADVGVLSGFTTKLSHKTATVASARLSATRFTGTENHSSICYVCEPHRCCCNTTHEPRQPIKTYFIFEILQSSHRLPCWQLCTLLAFSQPASPGRLSQQSWRSSHICWALGCFSFILQSNSSQTISIGLRSGDCGGQVIWCSTHHSP